MTPERADDLGLAGMNPAGRFSDRAADYVRCRPDYPAAAIACVLDGLGDPAAIRAADVGAGTGISARQLAARGARVIAIEPNREMREAAASDPRVSWRTGTGEATGLDRCSLDLVLCAQAFHWFRQPQAVAEFHRVLRPRGRIALMWNTRSRTDPFSLGYIQAIRDVNGEHPAEMRTFDPDVVSEGGLFAPPSVARFDHQQSLDREGLIGRAASASYVPKEGPRFEDLRRRLDTLHAKFRDEAGHVALRYVTEVWRAERLPG